MRLKNSLLMPAILFALFAQAQSDSIYKTSLQHHYLKKSKAQKTTAVTLLTVGGALFIVGGIGVMSNSAISFSLAEGDTDKNNPSGTFAIIGGSGVLMSFASIPFFHAARRNKKRAAQAVNLSLKMEQARVFQIDGLNTKNYPSLGITFNF